MSAYKYVNLTKNDDSPTLPTKVEVRNMGVEVEAILKKVTDNPNLSISLEVILESNDFTIRLCESSTHNLNNTFDDILDNSCFAFELYINEKRYNNRQICIGVFNNSEIYEGFICVPKVQFRSRDMAKIRKIYNSLGINDTNSKCLNHTETILFNTSNNTITYLNNEKHKCDYC